MSNIDDNLVFIKDSQDSLSIAINATPTGELRNRLCDINIQLLEIIKNIENGKIT